MRGKLIAIYSIVVLITGLLAFVFMRATLGDILFSRDRARQEAERAAAGANTRLQLEGLLMERWLVEQAMIPKLREPFLADTVNARSESATSQANEVYAHAQTTFSGMTPTLVAFVDDQGVVLGRNGSQLMRGDALGKDYPSLLEVVRHGTSGSDLWVNRTRNEQLLASFCAVRDEKGKVLGAVILGTALDEGRLSAISDLSSGRPVALVTEIGEKLEIVARSKNAPPEGISAVTQPAFRTDYQKAVLLSRPTELHGSEETLIIAGSSLVGYGDGKRAVLIGFAPIAMFGELTTMLLPILGATAVGLILAAIGAVLLGNYFTQPILTLEEGLLAIINGDTNRRFDLEHAELGGLISRINTLLDTLMGVEEDTTDAEGRPSQAPDAANFRGAMSVDGGGAKAGISASSLHSEPVGTYYQRLFDEYIQAKRSLGESVDHITKDVFLQKIQANEQEHSQRQGKPVRFRVELQGREVKLIPVVLE